MTPPTQTSQEAAEREIALLEMISELEDAASENAHECSGRPQLERLLACRVKVSEGVRALRAELTRPLEVVEVGPEQFTDTQLLEFYNGDDYGDSHEHTLVHFARKILRAASRVTAPAVRPDDKLVTRESAERAIEHVSSYNGRGRDEDARNMLIEVQPEPGSSHLAVAETKGVQGVESAERAAKSENLLSMLIGILLSNQRHIGYTPTSPTAKAIQEAVDHLKDWPSATPNTASEQGRAGDVATWLPMETAPTDGAMVRLLVDYTGKGACNPLEDADQAQTIGANNDGNVGPGEGEGWQFAGWSWEQDHFAQGCGKPIGWLALDVPAHGIAPTNTKD